MDTLPPSIRALARRLLAESQPAGEASSADIAVVSEKLRVELTRFAGASGFSSLLKRAVTLARAEVAELNHVRVTDDGHLEGLEHFAALPEALRQEAATAITAHVLGLLVVFIGEPLTQRLVRQLWPGTLPAEQN
jgi:hypothetical protein